MDYLRKILSHSQTPTVDRVSSWVSRKSMNSEQTFKRFPSSTGGGTYLLAVQCFSVVCLFLWGLLSTYPILWFVNKLLPIRLDPMDEIKGCDIVEHFMGDENEKIPSHLDNMQLSNIRFGGPHVNFNIPSISPSFYPKNATYKEFNTVVPSKPFNLNHGYERDEHEIRHRTSEHL